MFIVGPELAIKTGKVTHLKYSLGAVDHEPQTLLCPFLIDHHFTIFSMVIQLSI